MFFRNLTLFRFPRVHDGLFQTPVRDDLDQLAEALAASPLKPVGPMEVRSYGFIPTLWRPDDEPQAYVHRVDDAARITLGGEEKLLPPAVIQRELGKKIAEIEKNEGRHLRGRERKHLKADLIAELLPKAFIQPKRVDAYFDFARDFIAVDTSSRQTAESLVSQVRTAAGSFPALPLNAATSPRRVLTDYLHGDLPEAFSLGDECELRDPADKGAVVRIKNLELAGEEVQRHLESGLQCSRLGLCWNGHVSFVLGEDLVLRKLRFLEGAVEQLERLEHDDRNAELDARFALMSMTLRNLFDALAAAFEIQPVDDRPGPADDAKPAKRRRALEGIERVEITVGGHAPIVLTADQFSDLPQHAARFGQVAQWIRETGKTSISGLQRHLRVGYNEAARWIEAMERAGVVSPPDAQGTRTVIATPEIK